MLTKVQSGSLPAMLSHVLSRHRAQIIGWTFFAALDFATRLTIYADVGVALLLTAVVTPLVVLMAQGLDALYRQIGIGGRITPRSLIATGLACLTAALLVCLAAMALRQQIGSPMPGRSPGQELRISGFYFFMIFLSYSFIQISLTAAAGQRAQERRAARAEAEALRAELQRLRLQLDPHFLLNALNGIIEEIGHDRDLAQRVLEDLTIFLRHALRGRDQLVTSVGEEVDSLSAYLSVQAARFGSQLDAAIDVDADALSRPIASFLLQPLVENAIVHGAKGKDQEDAAVRLQIKLRAEAARIVVEVRNPGQLAPGAPIGTGVGLATITARLALQYSQRHSFSLEERDGEVVAKLVLEGAPCSGR